MVQWAVALSVVCVAALTVAADAIVTWPLLPPGQRGVPGKPSPQEDKLILDACITLFGTAYAAGRLVYRWCGPHAQPEEFRRWSRWHMAILKILGGVWLIASGWQPLQQAVVRPSLLVGAILVALTAYDGWQNLRGLRGGPRDPP